MIALWIFGPVACGKSALIARSLPREFRLVEQDTELERQAMERGLPLDCRIHDAAQAAAFAELRHAVANAAWSPAPRWRAEGVPIAFETTGDKPHLFQAELDADRAAGYRSFGIAINVPNEICVTRNESRARVLPSRIVASTIAAFERNLHSGVYERMFGPDRFVVVTDPDRFDIAAWLKERQ